MPANAWIFQSNPKIYQLRRALLELEEQVWRVTRYQTEMRIGDTVYFWEAGRDAGILAVGQLSSLPATVAEPASQLPFHREPRAFSATQPRVTVSKIRLLPAKLPKRAVQAGPHLAGLHILRCPRGANFRLTTQEAESLVQLIRSYSLVSSTQLPAGERRVLLNPTGWP